MTHPGESRPSVADPAPVAMSRQDALTKRAPKCFGSTFDGNYTWRCERRTRNSNGYCHQHQYQAPRGH